MKMLKEHLFVYISMLMLCIILRIVYSIHSDVTFSRSNSNVWTFKWLLNIPIGVCAKECQTRGRCKQALYKRDAKVCILMQTMATNTEFSKAGSVLMTNFDAVRMANPYCGNVICNTNETCVETNHRHTCNITECGGFHTDLYRSHGNMYDIDSVNLLEYITNGVRVTFMCGSDGYWTSGDIYESCLIGNQSGVTTRTPNNGVPIYCDIDTDGGKWVVFQRRQDGSENFYRNWTDYEQGFGNVTGEFWLGLKHMYKILSFGAFELRIDMEDFSGEWRYAIYRSFSIAGPEDNYRLHVSGYIGTAGDALIANHNKMAFSTYDKDNDKYSSSCAQIYRGAWWYRACHSSNLNGLYPFNGPDTLYGVSMHWVTWTGLREGVKSTEMKFRRTSKLFAQT